MTNDWTIQSRSLHCAATGAAFAEGEHFYTLLFHEKDGFRREDLCEEAYKNRPESPVPFSFWRSKFEPPQAAPPEPVSKQNAEDLLRAYMVESGPDHANARYILALMLERKRILREIDVKHGEDGSLTRIYERAKTGEVFVIPDPQLRLDQVEQVQMQVADLLGAPGPAAPAPEPPAEPAPAPAETEVTSPS
jgi:hypothetical protein